MMKLALCVVLGTAVVRCLPQAICADVEAADDRKTGELADAGSSDLNVGRAVEFCKQPDAGRGAERNFGECTVVCMENGFRAFDADGGSSCAKKLFPFAKHVQGHQPKDL